MKRFKNKKTKNKEVRTLLHMTSKTKDTLKSLFELPVQQEWLSDEEIEKINRDSTVTAAISRRKSATLKKEIIVTCDDKKIQEYFEEMFEPDLLDSILDTPYQGFIAFEINWIYKDSFWYPKLIERRYKEFEIHNGKLMFSANGMPTGIPEYKALYAVHKAKPTALYGQALYKQLFWLIEFKNASMEFWIDLLERFGTPWVIAKTDENKDALADEIYNMLGGDGAVLNINDELDIKTADKAGNFKEIIEYLDNQTRELITGGNLTGQVKGGSQAAATVHNDIREDIARADENILKKILKTTIKYFKEVNDFSAKLAVELKDKEDPNIELSKRDKTIYEMGYRPTKEYITKKYNIEVDDIAQESSVIPIANKLFNFSKTLSEDELQNQINKIDISLLTFQKQIMKIVQDSNSYKEVQEKLLEVYPNTNTADLEALLYKNMANADILGRAEIEEENPDG